MFFDSDPPPLPKITAPTAAEVAEQSKPSPEGMALLKPGMTPPQYLQALEKNKLPVDSVNFLAHGLPQKDSVCWASQSSQMVAPKLSAPEANSLQLTQAYLKNPTPALKAKVAQSLKSVDYSGPGSWTAQAAAWSHPPGAPAVPGKPGTPGAPQASLVPSAVVGAVMLAAGLKTGPAMPQVPTSKPAIPAAPTVPSLKAKLPKVQVPQIPKTPVVDQAKLVKPLAPFINLGKGVAQGKISCA